MWSKVCIKERVSLSVGGGLIGREIWYLLDNILIILQILFIVDLNSFYLLQRKMMN